MSKILIIYAPQGGYTELIASKIQFLFSDIDTTITSGRNVTEEIVNQYQNIIIGTATLGNETWDNEIKDIDINKIRHVINNCEFSNKKIALFGLGNSILYPNNFIDAVGFFETILKNKNADIIGYTNSDSYSFTNSKALRENKFCGLAIDFDNDPSKSDIQIKNWVLQIKKEFNLI